LRGPAAAPYLGRVQLRSSNEGDTRSTMTGRTSRIVGITAGLALAGSVCGAALGALLGLALASIPAAGAFAPPDVELLMKGGGLGGAVFGGLFVPTVAWARFRAVPFGQLASELGSAVVIGAAITWIVQPAWTPLGAVAGFLLGFRRLHRAQRTVADHHA
jgi:hypothetical protein